MGGASITVSTSDIKWSDGTIAELGDRFNDPTFGPGKISKLESTMDTRGKPRVTIEWDKGGSFSWETGVIDSKMRGGPQWVELGKPAPRNWRPWIITGIVLSGGLVVGTLIHGITTRDQRTA